MKYLFHPNKTNLFYFKQNYCRIHYLQYTIVSGWAGLYIGKFQWCESSGPKQKQVLDLTEH